jgi:AcrR family transcriptional regulator
MPRVTAAHEQAVRNRIIDAALRAFAEKGFHGTTMQDVVRESGLSVGAIYTYFKSKDDLFVATCDFSQDLGLAALADRVAHGRTTIEKLAIAIGFFLDAVDGEAGGPGMASFLVAEWAQAERDPDVRAMLVRRREQLGLVGGVLLREGVARGELPAWLDVDGVAQGYIALLDGLLLQRIEAGPAWRRKDAERQAFAVLEAIVAAAAVPDTPSVERPVAEPWNVMAASDASGDTIRRRAS